MNQRTPWRLWFDGWNWKGRTSANTYGWVLLWLQVPFWGALVLGAISTTDRRIFDPALVILAVTIVPLVGHKMRRLNDAGRSGWWGVVAILPVVTHVFSVGIWWLKQGEKPIYAGFRIVGKLFLILAACFFWARLFFEPFTIPSASMKPSLVPGDFVIMWRTKQVSPGDIVVFEHPVTKETFIKRLVAANEEKIRMVDGLLHLDGTAVSLEDLSEHREVFEPQGPWNIRPSCKHVVGAGGACIKARSLETLPNGKSYEVLSIVKIHPLNNTSVFDLPKDHVFMLGDNRDNSSDSRVQRNRRGMGFVPDSNIKGRAVMILYSFIHRSTRDTFFRPERWFKRVQ